MGHLLVGVVINRRVQVTVHETKEPVDDVNDAVVDGDVAFDDATLRTLVAYFHCSAKRTM